MSTSELFAPDQLLPEPLPADPWGLFRDWWDQAHAGKVQPNPNAMTLATVDADGTPSARIVLCKAMNLSADAGYIVFHSNRQSRKGRALAANARAALVFHWDDLDRQVRIEGPVLHSPDEESDAYFSTRPLVRRIGAWSSRQSEVLGSRDDLMLQAMEVIARFGVRIDDESSTIPRPPHWGGYRVWARRVELWMGGPGRLHERAAWSRDLSPISGGFKPGPWNATRLQP